MLKHVFFRFGRFRICAHVNETTKAHGKGGIYTGPVILFHLVLNGLLKLSVSREGHAALWSGCRQSARKVWDAAGGPCFNGGAHEDECMQCKRALTLFACCVGLKRATSSTGQSKSKPRHSSPWRKRPHYTRRAVLHNGIFGSGLLYEP